MNLNERRPGQQPRPRPQTHIAQSTPPVGPQKQSWRSQAQISDLTRTGRSSQNTDDALKTAITASPSLFRAWRLGLPPPTQSDPESDSFLTCAKKKQRLAAPRTRRRVPSLSPTLVGVLSAVRCVMCCVIPIAEIVEQLIHRFRIEDPKWYFSFFPNCQENNRLQES